MTGGSTLGDFEEQSQFPVITDNTSTGLQPAEYGLSKAGGREDALMPGSRVCWELVLERRLRGVLGTLYFPGRPGRPRTSHWSAVGVR